MRRLGVCLAMASIFVSAAAAQHPRATHDVLPVVVSTDRNRSSGVDFEFSWSKGSHKHGSLARSLAVFARLPRAIDSLPAREQHVFAMPGSPITPLPAKSRLLLTAGGASIYAEPTKQGSVCYFLVPLGNGSCVSSLLHGALPQVTAGQVWGLMNNAAAAVSVRVPTSGWLHAKLGRNAFYLLLPHNVLAPTEIVVRERSGARHVYTIKRCHIGPISPLTGAAPLSPPPC